MINGLERVPVLNRALINEEHYFQSLLEQAFDKELLNGGDIERSQYECLSLLAKKIERHTIGESSSVRVETAQSIMESILFTVSLWLKTFKNPDDALAELLTEGIDAIYQKGRIQIDTMLAAAKELHQKLELIETNNVFYRATLQDAIAGFFKLYRPDYAAHEIHITADYPLFNPLPNLLGIEFICAYLEAAAYENQFCSYFSANDIHRLLCGYEKDYEDMPINIYEQVVLTAIGCILTKAELYGLRISDAIYLQRLFLPMSRQEITKIIDQAAQELVHRLQCPQGLAKYIKSSVPLLANVIDAAARINRLDRVFYLPSR